MQIFDCEQVGAPNSRIVQQSTIYYMSGEEQRTKVSEKYVSKQEKFWIHSILADMILPKCQLFHN